MEPQREAVNVPAEEKQHKQDASLEEARESAVRNEVLPEGLKEPAEKPRGDVENGMT